MHAAVKVGNFSGDLETLANQYSRDFLPFPIGRRDVVKYGLMVQKRGQNYMLMVSNSDNPGPYDMIVSATGPQQDIAERLVADFSDKTSVELREAPNFLIKYFEIFAQIRELVTINIK